MQLGMPMTITNGGIMELTSVMLKPSILISPKDQITPKITTTIEMLVALKLFRNKKSKNAVTAKARPMKR